MFFLRLIYLLILDSEREGRAESEGESAEQSPLSSEPAVTIPRPGGMTWAKTTGQRLNPLSFPGAPPLPEP